MKEFRARIYNDQVNINKTGRVEKSHEIRTNQLRRSVIEGKAIEIAKRKAKERVEDIDRDVRQL